MGLLKIVAGMVKDTIGGALGDQMLETYEADNMTDQTVMTMAKSTRSGDKRNHNQYGTEGVISNGSVIHVYPNQFLMLVENGKIIDYTAEPGTFQVSNSAEPSAFNGEFGESLKKTFDRFKFGGVPSHTQKAIFINLQEIKNIRFGTTNPIPYFDNFYNSELFLRAYGNYSIQITDPILFYIQVVDKSKNRQDINDINEQYTNEFMTALSTSLNQYSADGNRVSFISSKSMELAKYMADALDEDWEQKRGFQVMSVAIPGVTYDDKSRELIDMRSKGAMLSDPTVREGYVQGNISEGFKAAGSNESGAGTTFMGMGMGMNAAGNFLGNSSQFNQQQWQQQQQEKQAANAQQNASSGQAAWFCSECGHKNEGNGKFCAECGEKRIAANVNACSNCGWEIPEGSTPKFCPSCGNKF